MGRLQKIFPSHQIDVMVGSLLGDARLECRSSGKRYPISARLRIHQGEKQKDYVFWKYEQLKNLVFCGPRRIKAGHDKKRDKDWFSWYFHTQTREEFGALYHDLYRGGIKIIPEDLFEHLTPRALAVWFMDDGSNNGETCTISTHNFSWEEQNKIVRFFVERYDIRSSIQKDRTKFKVYMGRREYEKLKAVITPFIIPSMTYKICNPRNDLFSNRTEQIRQASLVV